MKKRVVLLAIFLIVIFTNLASSISITINLPVNGTVYASSSVNVDVDFDESVDWSVYYNGAIKWSYQGSSINNLLTAIEGINTLRILASNISNSSINVENTTSFYVDTLSPSITSQTPANNSSVSRGNISFSVTYTEVNLNSTKLYWKNSVDSVYKEENVSGCASGTSISCPRIIDLSSLSYGTNISYFFSITDILSRNTNYSEYKFTLTCSPSWSCGDWSSCSNGQQTRTCTDLSCGTSNRSETQTCSCSPSWSCGDWSDSSNSCGTRTCTDSNGCGTTTDKPSESQSCDSSESTNTEDSTNTVQSLNYFLSDSQFNNGSLRTLRQIGDQIRFKIKNESHSLVLTKVFNSKVSIKISSSEQYANLTLNEVNKFDLTADNYYDVSVTLKRLTSNETDLFLKAINEKIPEKANLNVASSNTSTATSIAASVNVSEAGNETTSNETEAYAGKITGALSGAFKSIEKVPIYFVIAFLIFILGLAATIFMRIKKRKKRKRLGYRR